jgi:DNA-directed RNA polymerase
MTTLMIEAQLRLEQESVEEGVRQYRKMLQEDGNAALPPGLRMMKHVMGPLIQSIEGWLAGARAGVASRNASMLYCIDGLSAETTAFITAKAVIGSLHQRPMAGSIAPKIAMALETQQNLEAIAAVDAYKAKGLAKILERTTEGKNRAFRVRNSAGELGVKVVQWGDKERLRVGVTLMHLMQECVQPRLVKIEAHWQAGGTKTPLMLLPTDELMNWLDKEHGRCELLTPDRLPMVCPPKPWSGPFGGGYLTKTMQRPMVKTHNKQYLAELKSWDMPSVYNAINALQATRWAVNEPVYRVLKEVWEQGGIAGKLPSRDKKPLPAQSWEPDTTPDPEVLSKWKMGAAITYDENYRTESKRLQVIQKLWMAEKMMEHGNEFHFVYQADWRGRLYPMASALSPQGDQVAKGLLRFKEGVALGAEGAYWLAVHGANCWGEDKVSFDERVAWVQANEAMILDSAFNSTSGTMEWTKADSPYLFLAFCFEWAALVAHTHAGQDSEAFVSHIPVAFDGACNGLQNFSALLRDEVGGLATGLVPSETPSDVYAAVAAKAQEAINSDAAAGNLVANKWLKKMNRKLSKRNTMTVPYGVSKYGMKDQMMVEFRKLAEESDWLDFEPEWDDAVYIAEKNYDAIGEVVVASRTAMTWLQDCSKVAAKNKLPVKWEAPSGFLVVQDYRINEGDRAKFLVMGRTYDMLLKKTGEHLDSRRQSAGISPNFVHSLDAAHLVATIARCKERGMESFAMIHDSFGTHAGAAAALMGELREAFIEQYGQANLLEKFREDLADQLPAELRGDLPELPSMGSLDLEGVRDSDYFFA